MNHDQIFDLADLRQSVDTILEASSAVIRLLETILTQIRGLERPPSDRSDADRVLGAIVEVALVLTDFLGRELEPGRPSFPRNVYPDEVIARARAHGCLPQLQWAVTRVSTSTGLPLSGEGRGATA
jgi:hypothetical protein